MTILYYILYSILWIITLLPLKVLYILSDFAFILIYYLLGYRRKVVDNNLRSSFPEKSDKERQMIARNFYRNLCDTFIEGIKSLHLSDKQLQKRMRMENPEIFSSLYSDNTDIFILLGHHGNWEWLTAIPLFAHNHKSVSIYKPLENPIFDRLMKQTRSTTGATMVATAHIVREIISNRSSDTRAIYLSIADQTPRKNEIKHWTTFLHQDTPVLTGSERLAKKYNIPVYFLGIRKIKRGYYSFFVEPIETPSTTTSKFAITELYMQHLEAIIKQQPELYLWSHRRWKHNRVDNLV